MRISSKGRYAIAAMISMAQDGKGNEPITILSISEKLGISKIYLEQVFSLLKRANLVISTKGALGGYKLATLPEKISIGQIMQAVELGLFEKTESTVSKESAIFGVAMEVLIWSPLDHAVAAALGNIFLSDLVAEVEKQNLSSESMYFI